jgi:hypothetical protein
MSYRSYDEQDSGDDDVCSRHKQCIMVTKLRVIIYVVLHYGWRSQDKVIIL